MARQEARVGRPVWLFFFFSPEKEMDRDIPSATSLLEFLQQLGWAN